MRLHCRLPDSQGIACFSDGHALNQHHQNPTLGRRDAVSLSGEYSLIVGNENSLVGFVARWGRARPAPPGHEAN